MSCSIKWKVIAIAAVLWFQATIQSQCIAAEPLVPPAPATFQPANNGVETVLREAATVPACCPVQPRPTPQTITDVVVLVDSTVSMSWYSGSETRLSIAQWLSLDVADLVPDRIPAAFVSLFDEASEMRQLAPFVGNERSQLRLAVMRLHPKGDGKLDKLLNEASRLLSHRPHAVPLIVLVTDGVDCDPFSHGVSIRALHKEFGDRLHFQVVGICDNTTISAKLRDLANQAGNSGDFTSVKTYSELPSALTKTRSLIEAVWKQRDAETKWCAESLRCCFREMKSLTAQNEELTAKIDELNRQVQDLTTSNRDLIEENNGLKKENAQFGEKIQSLNQEVRRLTAQVKKLTEQNVQLNLQVTSLTDEVNGLKKDNSRLIDKVESLNQEIRHLTAQVKSLTERNAQLNLQVITLTNERTALTHEVDRLKQEKHDLERDRDMFRQLYSTWFWLALAFLIALLVVILVSCFRIVRLRDRLSQQASEISGLKDRVREADEQLACCRRHLEETQCKLKAAEDQNKADAALISDLRSEICSLKDQIRCLSGQLEEKEEQLRCCRHHLEEVKCQLKAAEDQNKADAVVIADLRNEKTRLDVLLSCCKQSGEHLERDVCNLRSQVTTLQNDLARAQQGLHDAGLTIQQQQATLTRLTGEGAAATAQSNQLNLRVQELQYANVNLQAQLSECKTGRAAADERVLGTTREMAANKKDCCPCPAPGPAVVYGPVVTSPSTPSTPVGGTPVGGTPGATSAGGPSAPAAAGGPAGPAATTAGPAGAGTAGPGTAATGTSTGVGGSPGVAGADGTTGVAGAGTASNSATPTSQSPLSSPSPISSPTPAVASNPSFGTTSAAEGTSSADSDAEGGDATAIAG